MPSVSASVAILGAGPAGLLLAWSLRAAGIDAVVVEIRPREHVLGRVRAGVLEQGSTEILTSLGLGDGIAERGMVHSGIYLQDGDRRSHLDFATLVGRTVAVYGQQQVVTDLVAAHDSVGSRIYYGCDAVAVQEVSGQRTRVRFQHEQQEHELTADFLVGADGFHGVSRASIPADEISLYERTYPYAWLGILADVAPSTDELIYARHDDGFAMHSMRSHTVSRLYLQVDPEEDIGNWPDERIWDALDTRLASPGWTLRHGPITEKSITPMRSFVASRLDYHRLFLVGDAGHIVPPTGAKGLNSAIADVTMLADGLIGHYRGSDSLLAGYGTAALARQWRVQQFSQWMTELLHRLPGGGVEAEFDLRSQRARIDYVLGSLHAQRSLAEQYTGLPLRNGSEGNQP